MHYSCYGLSLASDLELPELREISSPAGLVSADVEIRLGSIPPGGLPGGRQLGPYLWVRATALWLEVPGVARFLVSEGATIRIDPAPGVDADSVRVFLLGSALGALLFQRGFLVLHGNAIRIGDQCLVCVGHSGAGKSTLAAGFLGRGHQLLADDVVPVDAECRAVPGFPRIKLWRDTTQRLGIDTGPLRRIRPELEKFNYPLAEPYAGEPLPIRWVYILGTHLQPGIQLDAIHGMDRFAPLRRNTYRVRFLEGMALDARHLGLCGQLAGRIHLGRVTRPERGFELDALMDRILDDIAAHP